MSRKAKGPTPEDLIKKLQEELSEFKQTNEEKLDGIKKEHEDEVSALKEEHKSELDDLKGRLTRGEEETAAKHQEQTQLQEEKWCQLKEEMVSQLSLVKESFNNEKLELTSKIEQLKDELLLNIESLEKKVESAEQNQTSSNKELEEKLSQAKLDLDESLSSAVSSLETKIENASQDEARRADEISSRLAESNSTREESVGALKEELNGLNNKVDEILDSVGITIQDKLNETSSAFNASMANEAQLYQDHKTEMELEMSSLREKIDSLDQGVNDVQEKLYEFEQNRRNNLIFYGFANESRETPEALMSKVQTVIRSTLGIRRDIPVVKVNRMYTGPEVSGSRPVLVTFENFKDREEVLRKGNLLKGSSIHISEDLSKRTRESRTELRKYMRKIKRSDPSAACFIQYDKLYVNNRIYVWNDIQGRVVEQSQAEDPLAVSLANLVMSRPGSVMNMADTDSCSRPGSSLSTLGSLVSPTKSSGRSRGLMRSQSLSLNNVNNLGENGHGHPQQGESRIKELEGIISSQQETFADKMRDLEQIIQRQEEIISSLQGRMPTIHNQELNN